MTRVLVTGGGGFVGSHVVESILRRTDLDVTVIGSFTHNGSVDRLFRVLDCCDPIVGDQTRVHVMVHDLRAPLSGRQLAILSDVELIADVASRCSVDESIVDPANFFLNNVNVTAHTLEVARELRVSRYAHLSTDEIFGSGDTPATTVEHRPSSPYAASKAAQNDLCYAYARTFAVPATVVTSANMFGPRQSQLAFIPRIVRTALQGRSIEVHVHDGVPGSRRYSYVGDVADRFVDQLVNPTKDHLVLPGRYHVDNLTLAKTVVELVGELTGERLPTRLSLVEARNVRPGYDPSYHDLGAVASVDDVWLHPEVLADAPLNDRLRDTVEWFVANPEALVADGS